MEIQAAGDRGLLFGMIRRIIKRLSPLLKIGSRLYLKKPRRYSYKNISVIVEPTVFPPFITISTKLLLQFIEKLPLQGKTFLELGCGCGIISVLAAKKGAFVTATDINDIALSALSENVRSNEVEIVILKSNLFESLKGRNFNFIIINPPYYPKNAANDAERAWFCGENFEYFQGLFAQIEIFLTSENETYMILSEDCALEQIDKLALKRGLRLDLILERKVAGEKNLIFSIRK